MTALAFIEICRGLFTYEPATGFLHRRAASGGAKAGAVACRYAKKYGYYFVNVHNKTYLAHRVIWEMVCGEIPNGMGIDHVDGDGTNNRIENLRLSTQSQNLANARPMGNARSGVKGVSWNSRLGKWLARIKINQKRIYLGSFNSIEEAKAVYQAKAVELFGEFAFCERERVINARAALPATVDSLENGENP